MKVKMKIISLNYQIIWNMKIQHDQIRRRQVPLNYFNMVETHLKSKHLYSIKYNKKYTSQNIKGRLNRFQLCNCFSLCFNYP